MKYIKTYEKMEPNDPRLIYDDCRISYYWKIPTKMPKVKIALEKLGMDDTNVKSYSEMFLNNKDEYCFVFKTFNNKQTSYDWSWGQLDIVHPSYRMPPIFKGDIEVTDEEVELYQATKKFNL